MYVIILSQEIKCVKTNYFSTNLVTSNTCMPPWHYCNCLELFCLYYSEISLIVEKAYCTCKIVKCISLESLVQHVIHSPHGLWDLKTCAGTDYGQNVFIKLWKNKYLRDQCMLTILLQSMTMFKIFYFVLLCELYWAIDRRK